MTHPFHAIAFVVALSAPMFIAPIASAVPLAQPEALAFAAGENGETLLGAVEDTRAMWYQFYLQRDGALMFSSWYRGDDLEFDGGQTFISRNLGAGEYILWVQTYEPCEGYSPWSFPIPFIVDCAPIEQPVVFYPTRDRPVLHGFWPQEYVFSDPAAIVNRTATWGQVRLSHYDQGEFELPFSREYPWVEYDFPGQNGVQTEDVAGLVENLDGKADWYCREYSPCFGIGAYSDLDIPGDRAYCDVTGVVCGSTPSPAGLSFTADSFFHTSTMTENVGSTPRLAVNFVGVPWVNIYINNAATGSVVYNKWVHFTEIESFNEGMPKLPSGDYEFWSRSYHHDCGTGSWSAAPWVTRTVAPVELTDVLPPIAGADLRGIWYSFFVPQPGVDWYQVYVTSGSTVVMNQWVDVEDELTADDGVYPLYTVGGERRESQIIRVDQPYPGPVRVWLRSYSNSGGYSEWQARDASSSISTGPAPTNLAMDDESLVWESSASGRGQYDIYVARNGQFYYSDTVDCEFVSPHSSLVGWQDNWTLPRSYAPFFDHCDGEITVWVRSAVGSSKGPWSAPFIVPAD